MAEFFEAMCYEGHLNELFQQIAALKKHLQTVIKKETPLPISKLITDLLKSYSTISALKAEH